jgi:branched-chain amino acid transport system permease protein
MTKHRAKLLGYSAGLAALAVAPFFGSYYLHFLLATLVVYALVALSMVVLIGLGGQISIGHAAFWAIGAYGSTLLVTKLGLPFLPAVFAGGLFAAVFGAVLAIPALRVQGHYLAIATLGFALFIQQVLFEWESLTGGRQGLFVPRPEIGGYTFENDFEYFYLLLAFLLFFGWTVDNLRRSQTGVALRALKTSPIAAQCAGVSRVYHLFVAFIISAFLAGISGALYAPLIGHISTETFSLDTSLAFLTMSVIGGLNSVAGATLGAMYLTLAPEIFRELKSAQMVVYGLTLIFFMHFLPGGLASIGQRVWKFWSERRPAD